MGLGLSGELWLNEEHRGMADHPPRFNPSDINVRLGPGPSCLCLPWGRIQGSVTVDKELCSCSRRKQNYMVHSVPLYKELCRCSRTKQRRCDLGTGTLSR